MSEQENQKPTLIPPNFIEKGTISVACLTFAMRLKAALLQL